MFRVLVLIVLGLIVSNPRDAAAKMCPSMDIRNDPSQLNKLRNCTIIHGYLHLVLMHNEEDESVFEQYAIPELTQIVDYLLVFRVSQLTNLGKIFPNLKVIRGRKKFLDCSLVLYKLSHLQEVGLTNLQYLGNGIVKVQECPNLCYVKTVDWKALGASGLNVTDVSECNKSQQFCPNECGKYCWNNYQCQKKESTYCPNFIDNGRCVKKCPSTKSVHFETMTCYTKEECELAFNGTWWAFNGTCTDKCPASYVRDKTVEQGCRYVGSNYTKVCLGDDKPLKKKDELEELYGCTHINGSLELQITDELVERNLERYLGNVVNITGYLIIKRSFAIKSLEFLKNLREIGGEQLSTGKSLFVYENANLRKLWNFTDDFSLNIRKGNVAFHDNPQLCLSEIEELKKVTGVSNKIDMQISQYSNGYKSVCYQRNMSITIKENNPTNVTLVWDPPEINNDALIGYTIYYIKGQMMNESQDACDADQPISIFVRKNNVTLKDLLPYTNYSYYIKTYTTDLQGEQTPVGEFLTASMEPTAPLHVRVNETSDSSITLSWNPPFQINGVLTQYVISMFLEEDYLPTIQQRNYCETPHALEIIQPGPSIAVAKNSKGDNCTCPIEQIEEKTCGENDRVLKTCINSIYGSYSVGDLLGKGSTCEDAVMDTCIKTLSRPSTLYLPLETEKNIQNNSKIVNYVVGPTETACEFKELKHYSLYVFYLKACNMGSSKEDQEQCGQAEMIAVRTQKKPSADLIRNLNIKTEDKLVRIEWDEPEESNSFLVAYNIEYRRTDSEHSKPRYECIHVHKYKQLGRGFNLKLTPGKYEVRVQVTSYAGPGVFSAWKSFQVKPDKSFSTIIWVVVSSLVVISFITVGVVLYFRKKQREERNHLITSINPDYAGPQYIEDEWELDRKDVEICEEIGQGTFGMVYKGTIKSRQYPCAIKAVSENASISSRMEFLNEGAVMKSFNDAHHVIRLLGIVSRGQPPLVVMELMERGDLKSYLRRCREPSQTLTTNELYRMAAEIADGMAYLSAKKYIHRDLAARNCMVGADHTVKIGDFGMARDVYENDYYKKDSAGLLPVRWMAPESLADGVSTSDSDVWSYGIVLWEMATLAEQPYQGLSNQEVLNFVKNCGKPKRPAECSDMMYEIMEACWMWRPNDRPTFADIVRRLADHVGEDFRLVAFTFSEMARHTRPRAYNPPALLPVFEEDYTGHYNVSEDEVSLYLETSNRPPSPRDRLNRSSPYQISPGSPTSPFLFNSS